MSTPALRLLGPHLIIRLIVPERVHVPLRGRLRLYGRYFGMPPYYLYRVIFVDTFLDLSHQLILPLIEF